MAFDDRAASASRNGSTPLTLKLLIAVVALAPLPFAAVLPWTWTLLASLVGLLLLGWALAALRAPADRLVDPLRLWPVVLPYGLVCLWIALQAAGFLPDAWKHPLWAETSALLGRELAGSISLNPYGTFSLATKLLTYGAIFWLALQTAQSRRAALAVWQVLALTGLGYGAYGLFTFFSGADKILWFEKNFYLDSLTSSFVNRNSYAAFAGLGLIVAGSLILSRIIRGDAAGLPRRERLRRLIVGLAERNWAILLAFMVLAAALVLTGSRAGMFSSFCGLVVLLVAMSGKRAGGGKTALYGSLALLAIALLLFVIGGEGMMARLLDAPESVDTRLNIYRLTLDGLRDRPLLGTGFGTFEEAFRIYRDESVMETYEMAHNTYLELMFELGWPAALLMIAMFAGLAAICFKGVRRRQEGVLFPAVGLAVSVQLALHSLVDFSLQIPAVAATYALIMGVAVRQSLMVSRSAAGAFPAETGPAETKLEGPALGDQPR